MADATYHLRGTNSTGPGLAVDFITDNGTSDAKAKTVAQSVSTLLGCNVSLYATGGTLINSYTPGSQSGTVNCADGVVVSSAV